MEVHESYGVLLYSSGTGVVYPQDRIVEFPVVLLVVEIVSPVTVSRWSKASMASLASGPLRGTGTKKVGGSHPDRTYTTAIGPGYTSTARPAASIA